MELNSDFLLEPDKLQVEQVVHRCKRHRVDEAVACQEGFEVFVSFIGFVVVVHFDGIVQSFGMEEFVNVVS